MLNYSFQSWNNTVLVHFKAKFPLFKSISNNRQILYWSILAHGIFTAILRGSPCISRLLLMITPTSHKASCADSGYSLMFNIMWPHIRGSADCQRRVVRGKSMQKLKNKLALFTVLRQFPLDPVIHRKVNIIHLVARMNYARHTKVWVLLCWSFDRNRIPAESVHFN